MWFKQLQLFQLADSFSYSVNDIAEKLKKLSFHPCLPSLPFGMGWVPPIDENESPLVYAINHYILFCLQIEEKILPATIVRQHLSDKIKQIENAENRKIYQKEKLALKYEIITTLLARAFSKLTKIYGCMDTKSRWLMISTTNAKKIEQFLSSFKKSFSEATQSIAVKNLSQTMTRWLTHKNYPSVFSIEKACVLQDPNQQNRIIRCQQQDLFANSIQSLIKEGCHVKQLALCWQDRVNIFIAYILSNIWHLLFHIK